MKTASSAQRTTTAPATSGSRATRRICLSLRVEDFLDPAVDQPLAVRSGEVLVDGNDARVLQDIREAGLGLHVGMSRHEVDLVGREQRLHGRAGGEVDELAAAVRVLRALHQGDRLGGRSDALAREADLNLVTLVAGFRRVDD